MQGNNLVSRLALLCCALLAAPLAGAQTTYRWIDPATGRTVISDQPPPANAKSVSTSKASGGASDTGSLPFATRQAMEKFPVVLYTSASCTEHCKSARDLLAKRGVPFEEKSLTTNDDIEALQNLLGGEAMVPTVKVGNQIGKGYLASEWNGLLDLAGYPKTAPYGSKPSSAAGR